MPDNFRIEFYLLIIDSIQSRSMDFSTGGLTGAKCITFGNRLIE